MRYRHNLPEYNGLLPFEIQFVKRNTNQFLEIELILSIQKMHIANSVPEFDFINLKILPFI